MAGYTRNNSNITTGNVIRADDINGEFNDIVTAFNANSGHTHDGTSAEGAAITKVGPAQNITVSSIAVTPSIHNTMDLGTSSLRYKAGYFQGDVVTAGDFTGSVVGNVTGNLTGNVTGNITGDATGDIYANNGTSKVLENGTDGTDATFTGDVTGNADTATALATARTIAGQSFDGSANISIAPTDLTDVTATATEINVLDGITSSTDELNILDGVTADATEINVLDGVTSSTDELNILDGVTSSTDELNILDGVTSTATELNILDGVTADATEINVLDGITSSTAELNYVDGVTSNIQTQLDAKQATLTSSSNGYGTRTVSTAQPSGGSNGDIWYVVES